MKEKSNRYKCRNLPTNYPVNATIKSKPIFAMWVFLVIGVLMMFSTNYKYIGVVFALLGGYTLFFTKNNVSIEFSNDFMVVYLDDQSEECFLIYYNEVEGYRYIARMYQTDYVQVITKNKRMFEFKSLDRRRLRKNLQKYLDKKTGNDKK